MLNEILTPVAMLHALACGATDVNRAGAAELDSIKGIGPALSDRILEERQKGDFKDWADFMARVKGISQRSAARFSAQGLPVGDAAYPDGAGAQSGKKAWQPTGVEAGASAAAK